MTFLNGVLAFGAAALVIPLAIHLLNRSRFRTVPWGAMHLLETVIRTNNKRFRIEQLVLLLVRCAIPALLALCLARPVLTGWRALPGDEPASTVILLDDSYSMDAVSGDRSHFEEAIDNACDLVGALYRGSEVSVVRMGGGPAPVFDSPVFDPKMMIRQLRMLHGGYGASQIVESLEAGLTILSGMTNARRDLIVISDFQRTDWETVPPDAVQRIRRRLDAMPIPPSVTLLQTGPEAGNNVSIDSLAFSTEALGVGQNLQVRVNLRNYGDKDYQRARVLLRVDAAEHAVSQIALNARAAAQTLFTLQFKTPGSHVMEAEVAAEDQLKTDNLYAAAVPVLERIDVLLVDGAPSPEPLKSETDFLAVALTPFTFGRLKLSDLIETRTVTANELTEEAVSDARVVVLANVAKLSDVQVRLLSEYVRGGGSLVVFLGDKTNIDWHNQSLTLAAGGVLPMRIEAPGGGLAPQRKSSKIVAQHFDDPVLQIFNDRSNGSLADAEIWKWYRFGPAGASQTQDPGGESSTTGESEPVVLARLETGDPLLVEQRVGDGLVVQAATSCDADWSNLPMRPVYLPLMQRLITTMASRATPPCNIRTGEPAVAVLPGDVQGEPLSLTTPGGVRHTVRPVSRGPCSVVQFHVMRQPGVYTLAGPDALPLHFVAETSRTESDLRLLDSEGLESLAADLGGDVASSSDEYIRLDQTRRHGRGVWRLLFFGVLGLMSVELVLQQRFARVRT